MNKGQKFGKIKAFFVKIGGYFIWCLIFIFTLSVIKNISKVGTIRNDLQSERDRVVKMEADNEALKNEIAQAQSSDFIERQIRDKLGLAKAGEAIVVLPDVDTLRKLAPTQATEQDSLPDPIWKRWLKIFI
jgi:cell division protein FtsB